MGNTSSSWPEVRVDHLTATSSHSDRERSGPTRERDGDLSMLPRAEYAQVMRHVRVEPQRSGRGRLDATTERADRAHRLTSGHRVQRGEEQVGFDDERALPFRATNPRRAATIESDPSSSTRSKETQG
jgi:hypothetical protein